MKTEQQRLSIIAMWNANMSASAIAKKHPPLTKAAVNNYITRVREKTPHLITRRKGSDGTKPKRPPLPPLFDPCSMVEAIVSVSGCRFPTSSKGKFLFCDEPAIDGLPYCPKHQKVCHGKNR